ncbi:MAG: zinc ABC transporter substrate-binding protein [Pirellula sp.]
MTLFFSSRMGTRCLCFAAILLMVGGCRPNPSEPSDPGEKRGKAPVEVSATVGMVADLVRSVGGGRVRVTQICGSGVDPHLYKPTRDDVQALITSEMVFYSGLMLEGKMSDSLVKIARSKPVIAVTESIDPSNLLEPEDFGGHLDPHVWMDVATWSKCVDIIAEELSKYDKSGATEYRENADRYKAQMLQLHEYGTRVIATVPEASRILITSHDAFNYFGRAYGLNVMGVQGISTESEAGLQQINELVKLIVENKVQTVFVESSVSRKNIDALVEGAKSKGHTVQVGAKELFSDAMGATGTYEGTYIGMLDHNITVVARGLGGEAPASGFQGKLTP